MSNINSRINSHEFFCLVLAELERAEKRYPVWPNDIVHCAAIVGEEAGEVLQSALNYYYGERKSTTRFRSELVQTAAMVLRTFINLQNKET